MALSTIFTQCAPETTKFGKIMRFETRRLQITRRHRDVKKGPGARFTENLRKNRKFIVSFS